MQLLLVCALVLLIRSHLVASQDSRITVTPNTNHLIPVNSDDNFTYSCSVSGNRQAIWEINNRQISGQDARDTFAGIGVEVSGPLGGSTTELTFTPLGRQTYLELNQTSIPVRCTAFDNDRPVTKVGETLQVIIYDIPEGPINLQFNPDPDRLSQLTLSWDTPPNTPTGVNVSYMVTISGPRVNVNPTVTNTFYQFDDMTSQTCEEHTFSVQAVNPAGPGVIETMEETIPISPDISATSLRLRLSSIDLSSDGGVSIAVEFPLGTTCNSTSFPITNYSIIVTQPTAEGLQEEVGRVTHDAESLPMPVVLDFPALRQDEMYEIVIRACIRIACRNTTEFNKNLSVVTSDVQQGSVVFFQNNIFLNCSLADTVAGRGCIFNLSLVNSSELFYLTREDSSKVISQCNVSSSQNAAYTSFEVLDWESDGSLGGLRIPITPQPPDIEQEANYTQLTGCAVERPARLSGGAVAGIVLAILAVVAIAIVIVVAILVYKVKTGEWFKLKHKDEETVTVDFDRSLLMDLEESSGPMDSIMKSIKRSFSSISKPEVSDAVDVPSPDGRYANSPPSLDRTAATNATAIAEKEEEGVAEGGVAEEGVTLSSIKPDAALVPHQAAALAGTQLPSLAPQSLATPSITTQSLAAPLNSMDFSIISPNAAFTLDIVDEKRVRLHLNRGLIRRVLQQSKIRALENRARANIRKLRGAERSDTRPLLSLAMPSEVRVDVSEVDDYVVIDHV